MPCEEAAASARLNAPLSSVTPSPTAPKSLIEAWVAAACATFVWAAKATPARPRPAPAVMKLRLCITNSCNQSRPWATLKRRQPCAQANKSVVKQLLNDSLARGVQMRCETIFSCTTHARAKTSHSGVFTRNLELIGQGEAVIFRRHRAGAQRIERHVNNMSGPKAAVQPAAPLGIARAMQRWC